MKEIYNYLAYITAKNTIDFLEQGARIHYFCKEFALTLTCTYAEFTGMHEKLNTLKERITKNDVLILDSVSTLYDEQVITWFIEEEIKFICLSLPFSVENRMVKKIPVPFGQAVCRLILARLKEETLQEADSLYPASSPVNASSISSLTFNTFSLLYQDMLHRKITRDTLMKEHFLSYADYTQYRYVYWNEYFLHSIFPQIVWN